MSRRVLLALALAGCAGAAETERASTPSGAFATWPMPNSGTAALPNGAHLTAAGDVVRDDITGLSWERGFGPKGTWADAAARCAALRTGGGESGNWRLPTRIELVSITDPARVPTVDGEAFPETPSDYFWSATPLPRDPTFAFSVYFGEAETSFGDVAREGAHSRCVRGPLPAAPRYVVTEDLVRDEGTGLLWQRAPSADPLVVSVADAYCRELRLGGVSGFRVPSLKELQTLIDDGRTGPAVAEAFAGTPAAPFWSSTGADEARGTRRVVGFADGETAAQAAGAPAFVRCVR